MCSSDLHAKKETIKISNLKLATIPGRQYDPNKVAFDFTTLVQISNFEHEPNVFDNLFVSIDKFSRVYDLAKSKFQAKDMNKFMQFRSHRLLKIPLDQLRIPLQENESMEIEQKKKEDAASKIEKEVSASKIYM